ncbi:PTS transporter subunit EIIB [Lactobacillus acidophilus]
MDNVTHCVTRLRITIKDKSKIKNTQIQGLPGVLGTNMVGEQYQIILGG